MPGLDLAELFYQEAVKPALDADFPGLRYSAALIGSGSEILGFDTPQSMDHHWGPRLQLFIADEHEATHRDRFHDALRLRLPTEFHGFPTNFGPPDEIGVRLPQPVDSGPVEHMVEIQSLRRFFHVMLGVDLDAPLSDRDWLRLPQQRLLEVTSGRVFHDDLGLVEIRSRFAWYPRDVWLYLLSAQWKRIAQEEAFVGRTGDAGDEIGSSIVAARLVRDLMRLVFLMECRYAPYSKWLGTAFSRLAAAPELEPAILGVLRAGTWREREHHLSRTYGVLARIHNELGITAPLPTEVSDYYGRPYQVIHAERFCNALKQQIGDAGLRALPDIGGIDQIVDNTDVLASPPLTSALSVVYDPARYS